MCFSFSDLFFILFSMILGLMSFHDFLIFFSFWHWFLTIEVPKSDLFHDTVLVPTQPQIYPPGPPHIGQNDLKWKVKWANFWDWLLVLAAIHLTAPTGSETGFFLWLVQAPSGLSEKRHCIQTATPFRFITPPHNAWTEAWWEAGLWSCHFGALVSAASPSQKNEVWGEVYHKSGG